MKRTFVVLCLLIIVSLASWADKPIWRPGGGRSVTLTVYVTDYILYVESPFNISNEVHISMQNESGIMYDFDITISAEQPGVLTLDEFPAGIYDVVLTSDDGMATHGVLTIS